MKKVKKPVFFIVFAVIALFTLTTVFGVHYQYGDIVKTFVHGVDDIRLGIDIQGGVDVTFEPADGVSATENQMDAALETIKLRLANQNISDSETYVDYKSNRIIVRFPWQAGETDFDPEAAVKELGQTAELTFRYGTDTTTDSDGNTIPSGDIVLTGADVDKADTGATQDSTTGEYTWMVTLDLNESGKEKFYEATSALYQQQGQISIWMDNTMISAPSVSAVISDGKATITGNFTYESAKELADKINSGALPFSLETTSFKTISPTMGEGALTTMVLAGLITLVLIVIYMIVLYRLLGVVASLTLIGQVAGMLAAVSGWFGFMPSTTLTIPGIAGIILSVGMGVDANIITGERIREELRKGKNLDTALHSGYHRAFSAIFDGNLTGIIVSIVLMGAFGVPESIWAKLFNSTIFRFFGATTEGVIYSFGFTLLVGVIMNFIMACWATRLMVTSLSQFKVFRKPWMYGGAKDSTADKIMDGSKTPALPEKKGIDFVSKTKVFALISASVIVLTVIFSFVLGVKVDIRFKGGSMLTYSYTGEITEADTAKIAADVKSLDNVPEATVTTGTSFTGGLNTMVISFASDEKMDDDTLNAINAMVESALPDNNVENIDTTNVSASSGTSFLISCVVAVVIAFVLLAIYIAFRFQKIGGLSAGIISIICLLHDVAITYAVYVFGGMSLDSNFMAVILTLLGYSINNTIIIYDRLRENRAKYGTKFNDSELVNLSINQTLPRSIITTATTVCAMISVSIVCALMGTTSILTFSIPLAIGMLVGFCSSVCLAGPIWIWVQSKRHAKKDKTEEA